MGYEARVEQTVERRVFGVSGRSNDRSVGRDVDALAAAYARAIGAPQGGVVPLYVVSHSYDAATGDFELFVAGDEERPDLESFVLPAGMYARIEVRPAFKALWGTAMGRAKRWFYTRWLPAMGYEARNLEYELHTEKSLGARPAGDLLFAVRPSEDGKGERDGRVLDA